MTDGRDQRLDECAVSTKPLALREPGERAAKVRFGVAPDDVCAPTAEAGFDDHRRLQPYSRVGAEDVLCARMWDPRRGQQTRRQPFVVGLKEGAWRIENPHTPAAQLREHLQAGFDPIQRPANVDTT
jgi:hypothetical protein